MTVHNLMSISNLRINVDLYKMGGQKILKVTASCLGHIHIMGVT